MHFPLHVRLPDESDVRIALAAPPRAAGLELQDDWLVFAVPEDRPVYLTSDGVGRFETPAADNPLRMAPGAGYVLSGSASVEGAPTTLWVIEYGEAARLGHQACAVRRGAFELSWTTRASFRTCRVALRVAGRGRVRFGPLRLSSGPQRAEVATGPAGKFRARSIFFDPAGCARSAVGRVDADDAAAADGLAAAARSLAGCAEVLGLTCGSGPLGAALRAAGVERVVTLVQRRVERAADPQRLEEPIAHDLDLPFPFIRSARFDGVLVHGALAHLTPIALRTMLRESRRVLRPDGSLVLLEPGERPGADAGVPRGVAPSADLARRLLAEAGFEIVESATRDVLVEARARHADVCPDPAARRAQRVRLDRETQCSLRLARGGAGAGGVRLVLAATGARCDIGLEADGIVTLNGEPIGAADAAGVDDVPSACLRVILPPGEPAELLLVVWIGVRRVVERHARIGFAPTELRIETPANDAADLPVDHVDVWQPEPVRVEALADALTAMGVCRSADGACPDVDASAFADALERGGVERALVTTYGSTVERDTFDQVWPLAKRRAGRIDPLIRVRDSARRAGEEEQFRVAQLELLWQRGLLAGLMVGMEEAEWPSSAVLDWVERRQVLTMWHTGSRERLERLEREVLRGCSFPVLLADPAGCPFDREAYESACRLLEAHRETYLVTNFVHRRRELEGVVRAHPKRVLLGSGFPEVEPAVARAALDALEIPESSRALVASENLRFLTERAAWHRRAALGDRARLPFPPLPETADDLRAQGFEIVPPAQFAAAEPHAAKEFWGTYEVSAFFLEPKPWATLVAELASGVGAQSVLEFGCHVGRNLAAVRDALPAARLVGLDINRAAVETGRNRNGLDLRVGDERSLREFADGEFDLVFTVSVLDHVPHVAAVCAELLRVARRHAFFLEVTLPAEGKVIRHFDHRLGRVQSSTEASYSWFIDPLVRRHPRVWRLDARPCYLHASRLGPYYWSYLAFLD